MSALKQKDSLTRTFAVLADPTRRAILEQLASGEKTVNELAEPFDLSLPAISKHLKVLERARFITRSRSGKSTTGSPITVASGPNRSTAWPTTCEKCNPSQRKASMSVNADDYASREVVTTRVFDAPRELV